MAAIKQLAFSPYPRIKRRGVFYDTFICWYYTVTLVVTSYIEVVTGSVTASLVGPRTKTLAFTFSSLQIIKISLKLRCRKSIRRLVTARINFCIFRPQI